MASKKAPAKEPEVKESEGEEIPGQILKTDEEPTVAVLLARIEELAANQKVDVEAQRDAEGTYCECYSSIQFEVGSIVQRWGHDFEVQAGGRHMVGKIPAYDVENGTGSGRWKPVGMSEDEAQEVYWRMQYRLVIGGPAQTGMKIQAMRLAIEEMLGHGKEELDFVKA